MYDPAERLMLGPGRHINDAPMGDCLTPWSRILIHKLTHAQLVKNLPAFSWKLKTHCHVH